ncbi:MAG: hypothetical protein NVSMB64_10960 [Candidatus Velthaea sp.]
MKLMFLVSAGGQAMRRSVRGAIADAAPFHELRMLAPESEAKVLKDCGVTTESWRPAGLFNVLRSISALRRAVDRFEPDVIHAFGWTAAAVALGALPSRYASRTLVTLQDPIRKNEVPKAFLDKRLPELLARAGAIACAYETLRRVIVDTFGVPTAKVTVVPYGVKPLVVQNLARAPGRRGPIVGYAGRLEGDRAWEIAVDAIAEVVEQHPDAQLWLARTGPIASLVRAHARSQGVLDCVTFFDDLPLSELFSGIDMLVVPGTHDGLPYALLEALASGIPVVGADAGGIADTLRPYSGFLVPDDPGGFAAGIARAWSAIDAAWDAAHAQRPAAAAAFDQIAFTRRTLHTYTSLATSLEPRKDPIPPIEMSG